MKRTAQSIPALLLPAPLLLLPALPAQAAQPEREREDP